MVACCRQALLANHCAFCFNTVDCCVFVVIVIVAGMLVIAFIAIIVANTIGNVLFCDINIFFPTPRFSAFSSLLLFQLIAFCCCAVVVVVVV